MDGDALGPRYRRTAYWSGGVISREAGTIIKDWGWRLPVALVYPNSYFVGMSNLGLHAIYKLLNDHSDVVCERAFWQGTSQPLESVESARALGEFSCLAFSFSYELDYLNLPLIMRAGRIPLNPGERTDDHPIIMAGGPAVTANPAPLAPIFDVLAIGEAEAILPPVLPVLAGGAGRRETLRKLAALPGLLVPGFNDCQIIKRRYPPDLDTFPAHSVVLTPDTELGELYLIEVERGCSWGCRFCLVSRAFCPSRFRSLDSLLRQAREGLKYRRRIGLVGPVVTDHPRIEDLLRGLLDMGAGFSLSSLRLKPLAESLLELIRRGGAESLALAPETGSERLRRFIGKGFNEEDILGAVSRAAAAGFRQIKLYFMAGLPTETDDDAAEMAKLSRRCKEQAGTKTRLSINIAPFAPKAGTPFQRYGMADVTTLEKRIRLVKDGIKGAGIEVKAESPEWSQVQGALSRGDTRTAGVIAGIEVNSLAGWRRAAREAGLDLKHYVNDTWEESQPLPWAMVDMDSMSS